MRLYDSFGIIKTGAAITFANPSASVGLSAVNGSALTAMRSDASPPLSQAILPVWTNMHVFSGTFSATTPQVKISAATPVFEINETGAAANNRLWRIAAASEQLLVQLANDADNAFATILAVDRTANTVDTINFPNGVLQYGGVEVGYRGMPQRVFTANDTPTRADRGTLLLYAGAGGHTLSINNSVFNADDIVTLANGGSGTLTIGGGITNIVWFNGSGVVVTGNRTLVPAGVVTLFFRAANTVYAWGTGVS